MIAVRNGLVAATGSVFVLFVVTTTIVLNSTRRGMAGIDRDHMLINMVGMQVVQMSVVKIVSVSFMLDSGVAAARTMFMWVRFVNTTLIGHSFPPSAQISRVQDYLMSPSSFMEMHPIGAPLLRMPPIFSRDRISDRPTARTARRVDAQQIAAQDLQIVRHTGDDGARRRCFRFQPSPPVVLKFSFDSNPDAGLVKTANLSLLDQRQILPVFRDEIAVGRLLPTNRQAPASAPRPWESTADAL